MPEVHVFMVAGRTDEGRRAIAAWHRAKAITAFPTAKRAMVGALFERIAGEDAPSVVMRPELIRRDTA